MKRSADWLIDKHFKVLKPLSLYSTVYQDGTPDGFIRELRVGETIKIHSYLDRTNQTGDVWFAIDDPVNQRMAFFKYCKGCIKHLEYFDNNETTTNISLSNAFNAVGTATGNLVKPLIKWGLIGLLGVTAVKEGFKLLGKKVE